MTLPEHLQQFEKLDAWHRALLVRAIVETPALRHAVSAAMRRRQQPSQAPAPALSVTAHRCRWRPLINHDEPKDSKR